MAGVNGIVVALPIDTDAAIAWWRFSDGACMGQGDDLASLPHGAAHTHRVVALLPAAFTSVRRWAMTGMPPAQAAAAAKLDARASAIGDALIIAAAARKTETGSEVLTACADEAMLAEALARLAAHGLDPEALVPVGLLLPDQDDTLFHARFGPLAAYRRGDLVLPDEESLVHALLGDAAPLALDETARMAALEQALNDPPMNLRTGRLARKQPVFALSRSEARRLALLTAALVLVSLAVPVAEIARMHLAARSIRADALAAASKAAPGVDDAAQAEAALDARLAAAGAGNTLLSVPLSGLLAAMQPVAGANLRQIEQRPGGLIAATLAAPRVEEINAVLIALQEKGYQVTATQRQDQTGEAVAEITVATP